MNSGNWILDNIANALNTWNEKLAEIWQLIAQSPETFKGGGIWSVVVLSLIHISEPTRP